MIEIQRWYLNNRLRNYNYLIVNITTKTAIAIDPLSALMVQDQLKRQDLTLEAILLTHDHGDHIAGVESLIAETNALVYGNGVVPNVTIESLQHDQQLSLKTATCQAILVPGHKSTHVAFWVDQAHLFCGDTLFNAGVGNTKDPSASVEALYHSVLYLRDSLPETTKIYPAHDYFENNLAFACQVAPDPTYYKQWYQKVANQTAEDKPITTLADEKQMNIFLQVDMPVWQSTYKTFDPLVIFKQLRSQKDAF